MNYNNNYNQMYGNQGGYAQPNISAPSIILTVNPIPSNNHNDPWPTGTYTNTVNIDYFTTIHFHVMLNTAALRYNRMIRAIMNIYDSNNVLVFNDVTDYEWQSDYDRLSNGWILRGDDGSRVQTGQYTAEFIVENSVPVRCPFFVTSDSYVAPQYQPQQQQPQQQQQIPAPPQNSSDSRSQRIKQRMMNKYTK